MNCVTYSLKLDQNNSNNYYSNVKEISNKIKEKILFGGKDYLNEFMQFILSENIEELRNKEEYGLELLLIGILLEEYIDNARKFNVLTKGIFVRLNSLRGKNDNYKIEIDNIRGKLATMILMRKKHIFKDTTLDDFTLLLKWIEACGDFNEELLRLKNWEKFLKYKGIYYSNDLFIFCKNLIVKFYELNKESLGCYTRYVNEYLNNYKKDHYNKDDIVYCGKGEIQYFFNMISSEIINEVYRKEFKVCEEKIVFLPECMRAKSKLCLSTKTSKGYLCSNCSKDCNVGQLSFLGEKYGFSVFIMPHQCDEFDYKNTLKDNIGIIYISCVLNLYSEHLKTIRFGYKPQCAVLDYCGCREHWCSTDIMTNINVDELKNILGFTCGN